MHALALAAFAFSAWTALLFVVNLFFYREPRRPNRGSPVLRVSVVIPARNEEAGIVACVESVLASAGVEMECIVVDDHSTDGTAARCRDAAQGRRLTVVTPPQLPAGWNGKQHACWFGAQQASHGVLLFLDADVRIAPEAISRMAAEMKGRNASLISGVPHQETGTLLEKMLVPLIPYLLLGFLPFPGMRWTRLPGFAAGCGQFLLAEREAYLAAGGHAAIRTTMHDGIKLPRLLRKAGYKTEMASLEHLAACRMYRSRTEVWRGLSKNATEGLASAGNIVPFTVMLFAGQILPAVLAFRLAFISASERDSVAVLTALAFSYAPRLVCAVKYRQSWLSALLHPADITMLLALQWSAFIAKLTGRQPIWKERAYQAG